MVDTYVGEYVVDNEVWSPHRNVMERTLQDWWDMSINDLDATSRTQSGCLEH